MEAMLEKRKVNYFDDLEHLTKSHKKFLWIAAVAYFFDQMDNSLFSFIAPNVMA